MNLKEAFRFQNKLGTLMDEACADCLRSRAGGGLFCVCQKEAGRGYGAGRGCAAQGNAAEREARQICRLRPAGRRGGDTGRCASVCMGRKYLHVAGG